MARLKYKKNSDGKYPVTVKSEVTFAFDKCPTKKKIADLTEGLHALMFHTGREISRRNTIMQEPKRPDSFYTLRQLMVQLGRLCQQHPSMMDHPIVFLDKTTNEHHVLAWRRCDADGVTEFTPPGWGMCPAVVVTEVHRNWEIPSAPKTKGKKVKHA